MPPRIVIVGGGAAGIGAAGSREGRPTPTREVIVYTEFEDAAYSPCGIPYVHGKEIPDFERLFLAAKEAYGEAGHRHPLRDAVTGDRPRRPPRSHVDGRGDVAFDRLVVATGFDYADPGVPGTDLEGLYYVKNIRRAMEWDKVLDDVKVAVVVEATPLGLEMVTALAHRGIETHVVDPHPWALSEVADPDIAAAGRGVVGRDGRQDALQHAARGVPRRRARCAPCGPPRASCLPTSSWSAPRRCPTTDWPRPPGSKIGSTGGIVVDERMATSADGVFAAGDCIEMPHGVTNVPRAGAVGQPRLRAGQGGRHQRRGRRPRLPAGLRPVGHGGRASG